MPVQLKDVLVDRVLIFVWCLEPIRYRLLVLGIFAPIGISKVRFHLNKVCLGNYVLQMIQLFLHDYIMLFRNMYPSVSNLVLETDPIHFRTLRVSF